MWWQGGHLVLGFHPYQVRVRRLLRHKRSHTRACVNKIQILYSGFETSPEPKVLGANTSQIQILCYFEKGGAMFMFVPRLDQHESHSTAHLVRTTRVRVGPAREPWYFTLSQNHACSCWASRVSTTGPRVGPAEHDRAHGRICIHGGGGETALVQGTIGTQARTFGRELLVLHVHRSVFVQRYVV